MPTAHPRIGVTRDPELDAALRSTRALLHPSDARSDAGHVRRLALIGARALRGSAAGRRERERLLALAGARPASGDFAELATRLRDEPIDRRGELSRALDWVRGGR